MKFLPFLLLLSTALRAELTTEQQQVPLEANAEAGKPKVVLIAGSVSNKPGQHEYFAGCALLMEWLKASGTVSPVMVAEGWPKNEAVLDGASSVVLFLDGGAKLPFLDAARWARMEALEKAGTGFVVLHQGIDCPAERAADLKKWFGAVFQPDIGCRGHWDVKFDSVAAHDVTRGMTPFELLKDGWLYNLHFAEKGVTPLLQAQMPDNSRKTAHAKANAGRLETVAWAFERENGGRSVGFTGCDLHANWAEANQRRLLLNAIVWSAKGEVPKNGIGSETTPEALKRNWDRKVFLPKKAKEQPKP